MLQLLAASSLNAHAEGTDLASGSASPLVWQMAGASNTLYFVGSMHYLRPRDHPLPKVYRTVFDASDTLVTEVDMDAPDPDAAASAVAARATDGIEPSIAEVFGGEELRDIETQAQAWLGSPTDELVERYEPWWLALQIAQIRMARSDWERSLGVDQYFLKMAQSTGKPIVGLESVSQQITLLEDLDRRTQRELVLSSMRDDALVEEQLTSMASAWKRGDAEALAAVAFREFDDFPLLYRSMIVDRNRRWATRIEALCDDDINYLIVVGAMHLVGEHSLIETLRAKGFEVSRL